MTFLNTMTAALKPSFVMPDALAKVYQWMDDNNCVYSGSSGTPFGLLAPLDLMDTIEPLFDEDMDEEIAQKRSGGTSTTFDPRLNEDLHHWFGLKENDPAVQRVSVFANTGADGSMAALWLDDNDLQHIVHLGSGSGSVLTCVLASNPIDFLRLNAIGYDELCWDEHYDKPPNEGWEDSGVFVEPYRPFQDWVVNEFGVTIPKTASEIVKVTASMDDDAPTGDPFCDWVVALAQ